MKKIYFLWVGIILIILTGCNRQSPQANYDFRTGNEGLGLSLMSIDDRDLYLEGDYLRLAVNVQNKGSYNFPLGKLYISGYDKNAIFFAAATQEIPPLEGKTPNNPEGEIKTLTFEEERPLKVPYGTEYAPVVQATACYEYQTRAFSTACIIPDTKTLTQGKARCKPEITHLKNQGAPIAVTSVEQRISQNYMQFIVTVENRGKGLVINTNNIADCPFNLDHTKTNIVHIDMAISGLGEAICQNENSITLYENKGTAICKFITRPGPEYYETPLIIDLNYGYANSIKKQVKIVNPFYEGSNKEK
ncbi:hypothetical protein HYY69_07135 [Candidatus Woesearchaeota archaeon]|nr:hypothetical protein [Candidatus Woesearchaeota archaeon]